MWPLSVALGLLVLWVLLQSLISAIQLMAIIKLGVIDTSSGLSLFELVQAIPVSTQATIMVATAISVWTLTLGSVIFAVRRTLSAAGISNGIPAIRTALGLRAPKNPVFKLPIAVLIGAATFGVCAALQHGLADGKQPDPFRVFLTTPYGTWMLVIAVIGIAPFAEELFFRGFLYPPLKQRLGIAPAVWICGGAFSIIHIMVYGVNVVFLLPLFLMGLAMTILRQASGSTWPSVWAHLAFNATSIAFAILTDGNWTP